MLSPTRAIEQAQILLEVHEEERAKLDVVRRYWKGRQRLPQVLPDGTPREVLVMAASSRVNVLPIVIDSLVQSAFVDGFRGTDGDEDLEVWKCWQANRMDARQTAIHRAACGYGVSYSVVLPGKPYPVIRGVSPRAMCAMYGEDEDWPMFALERFGRGTWRLYDEEAVYFLSGDGGNLTFLEANLHGANVGGAPVVRFLDEDDLDADDEVTNQAFPMPGFQETVARGQIAPLMPLQDQIDMTTFSLQVAQHYGAFRQRYIIGWAAENERQAIKTAASTILTFDEDPSEMNIGEFAQTDLSGYINSREATLRHAATLSQTPVHDLIGALVNLSAEALAAAEAGKERKVDERKTLWGEGHEQELTLAGQYMGVEVPEDAQVIWRDTSSRAFSATVDGLGKLATMLGVPPSELWGRIPGVTQQDVERWMAKAESGDPFSSLTALIDAQAQADGITPAITEALRAS